MGKGSLFLPPCARKYQGNNKGKGTRERDKIRIDLTKRRPRRYFKKNGQAWILPKNFLLT
jgi:hypothetical protein